MKSKRIAAGLTAIMCCAGMLCVMPYGGVQTDAAEERNHANAVVTAENGEDYFNGSTAMLIKGDVDFSGTITAFDLALAKKGLTNGFSSENGKYAADIDENGTVEVLDVIQLVQFIMGRNDKFTVVEQPTEPPTDAPETSVDPTKYMESVRQAMTNSVPASATASNSYGKLEAITYFYKDLGLTADGIEYLLASCVENGHKNIHYIQTVAISWSKAGIRTVEDARQRSASYHKNCYTVLNAFGIKGRAPAPAELSYIERWSNEYGFSIEIIQEACNRTISVTHQPSFEYADRIFKKWLSHGVKHLPDIQALDQAYQKKADIL